MLQNNVLSGPAKGMVIGGGVNVADGDAMAGDAGDNLAVALSLADAGISVFPIRAWLDGNDAKTPCRGVRWRHESTIDKTKIAKWWETWPGAAPAVDAGKSGFLIVDADAPKCDELAGDDWLRGQLDKHGVLQIPTVRTGGGGRHWYLRQPAGGRALGNGRGSLPPKSALSLDLRGVGGFVVAPGAVLSGGRRYVLEGMPIADAPPPPPWLLKLLEGKVPADQEGAPVAIQDRSAVDRGGGDGFFRSVNDRALASLGRWVPEVFGSAAPYQPGTKAYRVTSRRLGRDLQEDLSIAPGGIVDWGVHDMGDARQGKRTPIDLVLEYGNQPDAAAAALWLCDRIGVDPASIGWRGDRERSERGSALAALIMSADGKSAVDPHSGEVFDLQPGDGGSPSDNGDGDPGSQRLSLFDGVPFSSVLVAPAGFAGSPAGEPMYPPGLVGDIAQWIMQTAQRPLHSHALGAALCVVGTVIGRRIAGPTLSGTHLYVVGLATTGAGKDHPLDCCRTLLDAAGLRVHLGGSEFMSMPAVINAVGAKPLSLWPMDEFGAFLSRVQSPRASGFERGISKIMRTLWGSSFKLYTSPEWAGKAATTVHSPALSIYGVSTAEEFYSALQDADVANGLLNRLLVLPARKARRSDPELDPRQVPPALVEQMKDLYRADGEFAAGQRNIAHEAPQTDDMTWGVGAKEVFDHLVARIEAYEDAHPTDAAFFRRTAETSVRIATIIAAGDHRAAVNMSDMIYGALFSIESANDMLRAYQLHAGVGEHGARVKLVEDAVKRAGKSGIPHQALLKRMSRRMKAKELRELAGDLAEAGLILAIEKAPGGGKGRPGLTYVWAG